MTADGGAENVARAFQKWIGANENVEEKQMQSSFDRFPILIASYDTLRRMAVKIPNHARPDLCCDEAHKLKNVSGSNQAVDALKAVKGETQRVDTGTPIQNNLMEFAAILDVVQPNAKTVFGWNSLEEFKEMYERPIMEARASEANRDEKKREERVGSSVEERRRKENIEGKAQDVLRVFGAENGIFDVVQHVQQKRCYKARVRTILKRMQTKTVITRWTAIKILRQSPNSAKHCLDAIDRSCVLDEIFSNTIRDAAKKKEKKNVAVN